MAPTVVQTKTAGYSAVNTATVVLDAAPVPGHLLLCLHQGTSTFRVTLPSGWTIRTQAASNASLHVHTRIVQAGDGTSYVWSLSATANADVTMLEISGQTTDVPAGLTDAAVTASGLTQTVPVSSPAAQSLLVVAVRSTTGASAFGAAEAGWTTHNQGQAGGSLSLAGVYSRQYAGPPDTNTDLTLTSTTAATVTYTSFSVPGTAPPAPPRQGKLPPQVA